MCIEVYIGTEKEVNELPDAISTPLLRVVQVSASNYALFQQFSLPWVHYVLPRESCACDFLYSDWTQEDEELFQDQSIPQEVRQNSREFHLDRRQAVLELSLHLARLLEVGKVELYACWSGDDADPPKERREITPSALANGEFRLTPVAPGYSVHAAVTR